MLRPELLFPQFQGFPRKAFGLGVTALLFKRLVLLERPRQRIGLRRRRPRPRKQQDHKQQSEYVLGHDAPHFR